MALLPPSSRLPTPRAPGDPRVEAELRRRLHACGQITFAEFMEVALYLPGGGYYEAHAELGRSGDFLTSPEAHPLFGALLARMVQALWEALGRPRCFHLVEYGAGTGSLCRQMLETAPHLASAFAESLRYHILERSAYLRDRQESALSKFSDRVEWVSSESDIAFGAGCVLANEVVDAIPVHRVRMQQDRLREIWVGLREDAYVEIDGELSTPELESYFRRVGVRPRAGAMTEVCLGARDWLRQAARRVESGYLVTIDYGASAEALHGAATPRGGLKCFSQQGWTDDPYDRPGLLDVTASVDFTNLAQLAEEAELESEPLLLQRQLLLALGLRDALAAVEAREDLPVMERQRNVQAMLALADPEGLGGYQVLVQRKRAPRPRLARAEEVHPVPLLAKERRTGF